MSLRGLGDVIPPPLAAAVGISVVAHLAVYGLTPVLSLHIVGIGGSSMQVGLLFSLFSLVAVVLRPAAGVWIDHGGVRQVLAPGAALMVVSSLALQFATGPPGLIGLMALFGVGYGLTTMAAAVLAASAPPERRARALSVYYLAAPVSMAVAAPLGLWLFQVAGVAANFAMVTVLGLAALAVGVVPRATAGWPARRSSGTGTLWSRGAMPLSCVLILAAMGQSALYAFLPLHASAHGQQHHLAWFFGVYSVGMIVFRVVVSRIADRWDRRRLLVPALASLAAGFGALIMPPVPLRLAVAAVLLAAGSSALYPMLVALVVDRVPDRERGVAMGMVSGAWDLGVFAGALVLAVIVERASHGAAFAVASALILAALGGLCLVERRIDPVAAR